jgi:magnesium transporter
MRAGLRFGVMARTRVYRDGTLQAENFPVADVSTHLADPGATVWLDLCAPTEADLAAIGEELGLHELAVEDAVHRGQRPKVDQYATHSLLIAYSVHLDAETADLTTCELTAFLTDRALVTVHQNERFDIDAVVGRWDSATELTKSGVGFLLHGLLDYIVDGHFDAAQTIDDWTEELEEQVLAERPKFAELQRRSLQLRKSAVRLRRAVHPMRDVLTTVMSDKMCLVDDVLRPYYQDVHDHVLRAGEWTDSLRDMIGSIRETQLNLQSYQLNDIMKKLTSWAAIIAVPTAITGFYGQNVPFPGFQSGWGFVTSLLAIVIISGFLYRTFRKRNWL